MQPIMIISDSLGHSAAAIVEAAEAQFGSLNVVTERLPNATTTQQIKRHLLTMQAKYPDESLIVFFTFVNPDLSIQTKELLNEMGIMYVDVLGPVINAIASASGQMPLNQPGLIHKTTTEYFKRIEAMEFAVYHDDGRNTQDLLQADIVLVGSSRTSKTPLSIYLAMQGYKVANVPFAPESEPPKELFKVEKSRIFGLTSQPELLANIRHRRLANAQEVAARYASIEYVYEDLEQARALMLRLGCIVIRTDHRAVEETAAEILSYYLDSHP